MFDFKVSLFALGLAGATNAVLSGIVPRTTPFTVTDTSKLPVTFTTRNTPTNGQDFTIVFGLAPTNPDFPITGSQLGDSPLQAINLLEKFSFPPTGNITLQVKLTKEQVGIFQPGQFTLTAASTVGFGALYGTQVNFFREDIELQW